MWESLRSITVDLPQFPSHAIWRSAKAAIRFQTAHYARWVGSAVENAARLHLENNFDLVYSRSLPGAAHIAGFWCAKRFNLPWIANINDPFDFSLYLPKDGRRPSLDRYNHLLWLNRTLRNADVVTYPCSRLYNFHRRLARIDHPAKTIPHIGYASTQRDARPVDEFRLLHAGNIDPGSGRSLDPLLLGLRAFLESVPDAAPYLRLVLVGRLQRGSDDLIRSLGLAQYIRHVGEVPYGESLNHIAAASVCVLIEAAFEEGIFFPSKLADYLVAGKPVLAFSPSKGVAADLADRGEVVLVEQDPTTVQRAIEMLYRHFKCGTLQSCSPSEQTVNELEGPSVGRRFLALCKDVIAARQQHRPVQ